MGTTASLRSVYKDFGLPDPLGFGYGAATSKKKAGSSPAAAQPKAAPTKARPGKRVRTGLGEPAKTAERTLLGN